MAISCDPNTLANAARCFTGCIPAGGRRAVKTYLLCRIASVGHIGSGLPAPTGFTLTINAAGDTMTANWNAIPAGLGITGTEVWLSSDNVTFALASTVASPLTTYSQLGPSIGNFFYVKIRFTTGTATGPFTGVLSVPTANSLLTSLVSYWKLNETGNNVRDDSQNFGNPAFQLGSNGSMTNVAGIISQAASSNGGVGTLVKLSANWSINAGDSFTISAWVQINGYAGGFRGIITDYDGVNLSYFLWHNNTGDITYTTQPASGAAQTNNLVVAAPVAGTWYYITFGYDEATQRSFWQVNAGARNFNNTIGIWKAGGATPTLALFTYLGGGTGPSNGFIDEMGWWRRTLTTAEVTLLYNGGLGYGYPNFR